MDAVAASRGIEGAGTPATRPKTLYRTHVEQCDLPENGYSFDFMSDYLSMMAFLDRAISQQLAAACGITTLQYRILIRLLDGRTTQANILARELSARPSTISMAVGKLAGAGLVGRKDDPHDMRVVGIRLTAQGRRLLEAADRAVLAVMEDYWRSLTPEQLQAAIESCISAVGRHSLPRMEGGEQRLDTALVETVMISRSLTARCLQAHGLTINEFRVILALRIIGGIGTATQLADFLFLNSSDLTSCLKALERASLITRQRSQSNRRVRTIELTGKGRGRASELLPLVFDALHETCHSDDQQILIHVSAARDLVARRRRQQAGF